METACAMDVLETSMPAAFATVQEKSTSAAAQESPLATATAAAIKLTLLGCVVGTAQRMQMQTEFATTWMTASGNSMLAEYAMVPVPSSKSRLATAIATGMSLMLVGCVVDQARHLNVAAPTSLRATAIAMATSLTPWACVVALAPKTSTKTASATTWTSVWSLTPAAFATVLARSTNVAVRTSPLATAIVVATSSTPWACVDDLHLRWFVDAVRLQCVRSL